MKARADSSRNFQQFRAEIFYRFCRFWWKGTEVGARQIKRELIYFESVARHSSGFFWITLIFHVCPIFPSCRNVSEWIRIEKVTHYCSELLRVAQCRAPRFWKKSSALSYSSLNLLFRLECRYCTNGCKLFWLFLPANFHHCPAQSLKPKWWAPTRFEEDWLSWKGQARLFPGGFSDDDDDGTTLLWDLVKLTQHIGHLLEFCHCYHNGGGGAEWRWVTDQSVAPP